MLGQQLLDTAEAVKRPAGFENIANAAIPQLAPRGIGVSVGCRLDSAEVLREGHHIDAVRAYRADKSFQVRCRRRITQYGGQ